MTPAEEQRAEQLRKRMLVTAVVHQRDAYGFDGDLHVGVDIGHHGDPWTIVTGKQNTDGSLSIIDVAEKPWASVADAQREVSTWPEWKREAAAARAEQSADQWRGHAIEWRYVDTGQPVRECPERACGYCGRSNTDDGHDGCIGVMPCVSAACCGHGEDEAAYVVFDDGQRLEGAAAVEVMAWRQWAIWLGAESWLSDDAIRSWLSEIKLARVAVGEALEMFKADAAALREHAREIYEAAERGGCSREALAVLNKHVPVHPLTDEERERFRAKYGRRRS